MKKLRKICTIGVIFVILFNISGIIAVHAIEKLPAPILISPNGKTITGKVKPLITGLTRSDTFVHVYIDGKYNGKTAILNHPSGTSNFSYRPFLNLSVGEHTVWAVAEDATGRRSAPSPVMNFHIELPFPAPTLFPPVVNKKTVASKPFIVGLAKNNSKIRVFIDHKLYGEFRVENHESGTANFAHLAFVGLTEGRHLVYTTAIDERGKESVWSNIVYFSVGRVSGPRISAQAAEERYTRENAAKVLGDELKPEGEKAEGGHATGSIEAIEAIWKDKQPAKGALSGLIDESRERQGRMNFNLIILLLFLMAVIGWIFWVNREIIAEKREREKGDENKTGGYT